MPYYLTGTRKDPIYPPKNKDSAPTSSSLREQDLVDRVEEQTEAAEEGHDSMADRIVAKKRVGQGDLASRM